MPRSPHRTALHQRRRRQSINAARVQAIKLRTNGGDSTEVSSLAAKAQQYLDAIRDRVGVSFPLLPFSCSTHAGGPLHRSVHSRGDRWVGIAAVC